MKLKFFAALAAFATSANLYAVDLTADYHLWNAKAEGESRNLNGVGIGVSTDVARRHGLYARADYQSGKDVSVGGIEAGYQHSFLPDSRRAYLLGKVGVGYAVADIDGVNADNDFVTLPIGLEAGYRFNGRLGIYAGVGYKWAFNTTENTTCADGRTTDSTGRGSCSYHGGIAQYNEKIGDVSGANLRVGLRFSF